MSQAGSIFAILPGPMLLDRNPETLTCSPWGRLCMRSTRARKDGARHSVNYGARGIPCNQCCLPARGAENYSVVPLGGKEVPHFSCKGIL